MHIGTSTIRLFGARASKSERIHRSAWQAPRDTPSEGGLQCHLVPTRWTAHLLVASGFLYALAGAIPSVEAKPTPCTGGRYLLDEPLVDGPGTPAMDAVILSGRNLATASGCDVVTAKVRATKKATLVRARFTTCRNIVGKARLTAKITSECTTMTGVFRAKGSRIVKKGFSATLSTCGDGLVDREGGEECDGTAAGDCPGACAACLCPDGTTSTSTTIVPTTVIASTTLPSVTSSTATTTSSTSTTTSTTSTTTNSTSATASTTSTTIPKQVFISSQTYSGDLGGVVAADAECAALAAAAGLTGTFRAWLADQTSDPSSSFVRSDGPYSLINETILGIIASNWVDLTDGTLSTAINVDEHGALVSTSRCVWTNVDDHGATTFTGNAGDCNGWTAQAANLRGETGNSGATDSDWTQSGTRTCNSACALYCFEQ